MHVFVVFLILAYSAWARGGTQSGYQPPMMWLGWLCLGTAILSPLFEERSPIGWALRAAGTRLIAILRDPVFYTCFLFLSLLALQRWNARWPSLSMEDAKMWIFGAPRVEWLPSCVTAREGTEMLYWFFPAFAAVLCIRHGLDNRRSIRILYWLIMANAGLLAAFGIVQLVSGTHSIYWRQPVPLDNHFFAAFGYANHAGAFFTLIFCIGAGLLLYYMRWRTSGWVPLQRKRGQWVYWFLGPALAVSVVAAVFSLSRTATVLTLLASVILGASVRTIAGKSLTKATRFYILISVLGLAVLAFLAVNAFVGKRVRAEFEHTSAGSVYDQTLGGRFWQTKAAAAIWRDNPWFGVGGWGYRYYIGFYVEEEILRKCRERKIGAANVHNDPVQFLAEFGVIGFGLLFATAALLIWPVISGGAWKREIVLFPLLGVGMVLVQSLIDLPLRCPAILNTCFVVLAASGEYVKRLDRG